MWKPVALQNEVEYYRTARTAAVAGAGAPSQPGFQHPAPISVDSPDDVMGDDELDNIFNIGADLEPAEQVRKRAESRRFLASQGAGGGGKGYGKGGENAYFPY